MSRFVAPALLLLALSSSSAESPASDAPRLARSLDDLRELADRYADSALGFTCDETIRHYTHRGRRDYKFQYLYRRRADGSLDDYRLAFSRRAPQTLAETGLPSVLRRPYSWIFLFDDGHAPFHDYELVGEQALSDRRVLGIRATPRKPYARDVNEWVATAWVDVETGELLRVDAIHVQDVEFRRAYRESLTQRAPREVSYTFEEVVTEFAISARNLRLPSEARLLKMTYPADGGRPWRNYLVRQIYRNYRFFTVEAHTMGEASTGELRRAVEPAVPTLSDLDLPRENSVGSRATHARSGPPDLEAPSAPRIDPQPPSPPRTPSLTTRIVEPDGRNVVSGATAIRWQVAGPGSLADDVEYRVYLEPFPAPVCTVRGPPLACWFDAGNDLQSRTVRVEAWSAGRRASADRVTTPAFPRPESVERFTLGVSAVVAVDDPAWNPSDLECSYGGRPCRVVSGEPLAVRRTIPVSLEILVDTSMSVRLGRYELLQAARRVIDEAPGDVAISVAEFSTHYMRVGGFTRDRSEVDRAVNRISGGMGESTCLYAAMRRSLRDLAARPGHRLLFVISDGWDNCDGGQMSTLRAMDALGRVAEISRQAAAPIYTYTLRQPGALAGVRVVSSPKRVVAAIKGGLERHGRLFEGLAAETGGHAVSRSEFTSIAEAFDGLLQDLERTWILDIDVAPSVAEGSHRLVLSVPEETGTVRHPLFATAGGREESLIAMLESPEPEHRRFALDRFGDRASPGIVRALGRVLERETVESLREDERRAWVRAAALLLVHGNEPDRRAIVRLLTHDTLPDGTGRDLAPYVDLALRLERLGERDAERLRDLVDERIP